MAKKKSSETEIDPEEMIHEAEAQGSLTHEEAEEILHDGEVATPKLSELEPHQRLPKPDFEQAAENNVSYKEIVDGVEVEIKK